MTVPRAPGYDRTRTTWYASRPVSTDGSVKAGVDVEVAVEEQVAEDADAT